MTNEERLEDMTAEALAAVILELVMPYCDNCPAREGCSIDPRYEDRAGCEGRVFARLGAATASSGVLEIAGSRLREAKDD